jgi:hypothetical protein
VLTVCSIAFSQTKDCDDLSGYYVCVENRFLQQKINWCWECYYGVYPPSKYVDPYAFVWGGSFAAIYYLSPRLAYYNYHIGWFPDMMVRSNVCGPNVEIPVWIGAVNEWSFYVFYDPYKRENKIVPHAVLPWFWNCAYPSLSPEIVLLEGTFECPGGPNLERDAKYLREIKYGKGACDEDKCKCVDFPHINQCNLLCSREKYDKREKNFCSLGCALSSLVSVMQYVGCNVDPCKVNEECNECFDDKGNVIWSNIIQKYCLNKLSTKVERLSCPRSIEEWKKYCNSDKYVIINVNTEEQEGSRRRTWGNRNIRIRSSQHFVVFKCIKEDGTLETMDPAYSGKYKLSDCRDIRVIYKK